MTTKAALEPRQEIDVKQIDIIIEDNEEYEGVTMMPIQNKSEDIKYVIVVQEHTEQVVSNIQDESIRMYDFDEKDVENIGNSTQGHETKKLSKRFHCRFCSYTSHRRYLLMRHLKCHSEVRDHKCDVCGRGFKTVNSLYNHTNTHYGLKPHTCKYCNNSYTTSGELVRHIKYKHTHEKPHKCNECDYASVELSKLRRHLRCHTGERPYQCPHCTYASVDTFKLKRHLRVHTGEKPYKCELCNMQFTQSNTLKAHKRIHNVSERAVFACELCPTTCGRKTDLRIHIQKLHTTAHRPFKCKICGQTFADRYSWKIHKKTHKGEKCFKCEMCSFATCTMSRLKNHTLMHVGDKPFACQQCNQRFRQKQLLRRHENLHHKPGYVPLTSKEKIHCCNQCGRVFAYPGNLTRHLTSHEATTTSTLQDVIPDQIKEVQCVSEQPEFKLELSNFEPSDVDHLKHNKKIILYEPETKSCVVIEVVNNPECEINEIPTEYADENILVDEEMMDTEDVNQNLTMDNDMDVCIGYEEHEIT